MQLRCSPHPDYGGGYGEMLYTGFDTVATTAILTLCRQDCLARTLTVREANSLLRGRDRLWTGLEFVDFVVFLALPWNSARAERERDSVEAYGAVGYLH